MEIKKLFQQMEQVNKFVDLVGDTPFILECCFDDCDIKKFATYKAFKKYLDDEYINAYKEELLKQDINIDSKGCADVHFSWFYRYGNNTKEINCHFSLVIYKNYR